MPEIVQCVFQYIVETHHEDVEQGRKAVGAIGVFDVLQPVQKIIAATVCFTVSPAAPTTSLCFAPTPSPMCWPAAEGVPPIDLVSAGVVATRIGRRLPACTSMVGQTVPQAAILVRGLFQRRP